ncbi:MAG: 3-keto-disaccharide hydrolase [Pirellulales bacterium]
MRFDASVLIVCAALAGAASAAPLSEATVQGLYEGTCAEGAARLKVEARLVACGQGTFKLFVRWTLDGNKLDKVELDGKIEGESLALAGKAGDVAWSAAYADGAIKGMVGQQVALELRRVERRPPTLEAKSPKGAIVLLDGKNFDELTTNATRNGKQEAWKLVDGGGIQVPPGGMNSKRQFDGSFKLHVEFKIPLMPAARDQGRGNSGVYLPNGDEIQVLDSFGMTTYKGGGCGGLYAYKDPDTFDRFSLASLPPLVWQTYDIEYRVPTKDGKPAGKPRVTVLHNGIKIHDNAELQREARAGGFFFQDHGNPVQYRNIWVLPLEK